MQISYENKLSYGITSVSDSVTGFGAENLFDTRLSKLFKWSGIEDKWVKFSSSALQADRLYIANHNFTSAVTITLEGNDTDVWTAPSFSESVTWQEDIIYHDFTSSTYNFWRVTVDDPTNTDTTLHMGYMFLGEYFQMPGMTPDQEFVLETTSIASDSLSGQGYGDIGYEFRNPNINFPNLTNTQRLNLEALFKYTRNVYPFFMAIWNNNKTVETIMYCKIDQKNLSFKKGADRNAPWAITIKFKEQF